MRVCFLQTGNHLFIFIKKSPNNKEDLKEVEAATKIQALYRGFRTRLKLEENHTDKKAAKKKDKQEEEKRADALLKVVLEDKAQASQEAKLNQRNPEEEVFRSLRKIIQKSIDQDEPPEINESIVEQVNDLTTNAKPNLLNASERLGEQISNKITSGISSGIELAGKAVEQAYEGAKQAGQSIKETIEEETKQELENAEQTIKETSETVNNQMDQLKEKFQEFDISKVASETVENVKEKVSGLIPEKVKEMLPDKKSDSESRPESGKSDSQSENDTSTTDKSSEKKVSKDENNNPGDKKQEEEVDIDLADPEVAKVANKLQSAFKFKRNVKPVN